MNCNTDDVRGDFNGDITVHKGCSLNMSAVPLLMPSSAHCLFYSEANFKLFCLSSVAKCFFFRKCYPL